MTRVAAAALLFFALPGARTAIADSATPAESGECIEIKSVGSQDKPYPTFHICLGKGPAIKAEPAYHWRFWFDEPAFRTVEAFVSGQEPQFQGPKTKEELGRFGTFQVRWVDQKKNVRSYVVTSDSRCTYFDGLAQTAKGQNPAFVSEVGRLEHRLGCRVSETDSAPRKAKAESSR